MLLSIGVEIILRPVQS